MTTYTSGDLLSRNGGRIRSTLKLYTKLYTTTTGNRLGPKLAENKAHQVPGHRIARLSLSSTGARNENGTWEEGAIVRVSPQPRTPSPSVLHHRLHRPNRILPHLYIAATALRAQFADRRKRVARSGTGDPHALEDIIGVYAPGR